MNQLTLSVYLLTQQFFILLPQGSHFLLQVNTHTHNIKVLAMEQCALTGKCYNIPTLLIS